MSFVRKLYREIEQGHRRLLKSVHELKSIGVEITNRCNLQCRHCYMSSVRAGSGEIPGGEWLAFFDRVRRDFGPKLAVQITGGEPLVREDVFDILRHLKKLGFKTSLVTNGTLLDEAKLGELAGLVSGLSVSLDGFADSHDRMRGAAVFDRVAANIRLAKGAGIGWLVVKTTVSKGNLRRLAEFRRFVEGLGADEWHLFAMEPIGRGAANREDVLSVEEYLELCGFIDGLRREKAGGMLIRFEEEGSGFMYDQACELCKYKLCNAGITSCAILYNGDVVNCIQDDRSRLDVQGNIRREDLKRIWDEKFAAHRETGYDYCDNHFFLNRLSGKR